MSTLLVHADELAAELRGDTPPTVLDVRWWLGGPSGAAAYAEGHLPGAVFVDLDTELAAPAGAGSRHPLPTVDEFTKVMRRAGVWQRHPVVVYDAGDSMAASRAWWCLGYFGHPDVRVLDGGYAAWQAAGLPVITDAPAVDPGDFVAQPGGLDVLDADAAAEVAHTGTLLDVRTPERYRGESEPVDPVAGHIPGAVNAPGASNTDAEGRFLQPAVLRERFVEFGAGPEERVGVYCGSGVTAAQTVLALQLADLPAALYPGSWSDWIAEGSRPIATGDEPAGR